jgi:hypothetical protein
MGDTYASAWSCSHRSVIKQGSCDPRRRAIRVSGSGNKEKYFKEKDLMGVPWRLAIALQDDGWYLRQDIIWSKPNPMPESVTDRCTKSHEYIFVLTKSSKYWSNMDTIREPSSMSSIKRLAQDVDSQKGSDRVPGKTNGTMKAV